MDESSSEEIVQKMDHKPYSTKLKPCLDVSNNSQSQNEEDDIYFSTNCLIKMKTEIKPSSHFVKKKLFDSDDSDFKKNLFTSDSAQKTDLKKSSEVLSTAPTSFNTKTLTSPRKKYSMIKMVEKKKKKNNNNLFTNKIVETKLENDKKERLDFYGNVIEKKNKKKVKVSFIDIVTSQPLVNVIDIESFKNYNYIEGMHDGEKLGANTECVCCLIF